MPERLQGHDLVLYGEPLFADVVTPTLGLALLEPSSDWTERLPDAYRQRAVRVTTLAEARGYSSRSFIKPAGNYLGRAGAGRAAGRQGVRGGA